MAEEFVINSTAIEDKINQLLPSQGGFGAGVDFSASTMIIPIIDLTESASGATVRADLQTAQSLTNSNAFTVGINTTVTLLNGTGYWLFQGHVENNGVSDLFVRLTDGTTTKNIYVVGAGDSGVIITPLTFTIFLAAGESITATTGSDSLFHGSFRQIADLSGNLIQPT